MEQLISLCNDSMLYPQNFTQRTNHEYKLGAYYLRINEHSHRLFTPEKEASLDFWDFDIDGKTFWPTNVSSMDRLKIHLNITPYTKKKDPRSRFLFVRAAGNSRERLKTSRDMLMLAFTYLQVMPEFLDYLLLFGKQIEAQDLYWSGFHQLTYLTGVERGLELTERSWSGCGLQVCYTLKSVEPSGFSTEWPWSIRHCAIHHAFDAENIRSTWIVIKGDQLIKKRIQSATRDCSPPELSSFETIDRAFAAALATHLVVCDWSAENWRWYIKFLEEKLEELTRETTSTNADVPVSPADYGDALPTSPQSHALKTHLTERSQGFNFPRFPRSQNRDAGTDVLDLETQQPFKTIVNYKDQKQPLPPGRRLCNIGTSNVSSIDFDDYGQRQFSFRDLQEIQHIEEKANETTLILKLNINVISRLKQYYRSIIESNEIPANISQKCVRDMIRFERNIEGIVSDILSQILRVEALLRRLVDRKALLYGLLDLQNTQLNRFLALQSRRSTKNMEHMTRDMDEIARKTKTETVSMKIITLVTLFFLPGTFISTFMSAEIVNWKRGQRAFQPDALQFYLFTSLPLMFISFACWAVFLILEKRKERKKSQKMNEEISQPSV